MRIVRIIDNTDLLYTLFNEDEQTTEYDFLLEQWTDQVYLNAFFEANKLDLSYFSIRSVEAAVQQTLSEAEEVDNWLIHIAENEPDDLQRFFKPLSDSEYRFGLISRNKGYGIAKKSWLRIYAIGVGLKFIITGGAIKLTQTMQEREHTREQLKKLNSVKDYLKAEGIGEDNLSELEIDL